MSENDEWARATAPLVYGTLYRVSNREHNVLFTGPIGAFILPPGRSETLREFFSLRSTEIVAKQMTFPFAALLAREPGFDADVVAQVIDFARGVSNGERGELPIAQASTMVIARRTLPAACLFRLSFRIDLAQEIETRPPLAPFADPLLTSMGPLHWSAIRGDCTALAGAARHDLSKLNFYGATPGLLAKLNGHPAFFELASQIQNS